MGSEETVQVAILGGRWGEADIEQQVLRSFPVEWVSSPGTTPEEIVASAGKASVILAGSGPRFNRAVLEQLGSCRAIIRYGIGAETIDIPAATSLGILVANVPDYCTEEVATHTLALILASVRKLLPAQQAARQGNWRVDSLKPLYSTEDQVLGIVGFGKIGRSIARKAHAFGFEILVYDPLVSEEDFRQAGVAGVTLENLLRRSDVISLNAPLTPQTRHLIDAQALRQMKPSAFLVNTSRGGLVDEGALDQALRAGRLAGAALDVLEDEPVPAGRPILDNPRALVTPHMSWYTEQALERMRRLAAEEARRVLRGEKPKNLLNPQALEPTTGESLRDASLPTSN